MTKICRISPWCAGGPFEMWQVAIDGTCVVVLRSRSEALEAARRIVRELEQSGVSCEAVLSTGEPTLDVAA
jgi:hypothetical protein